MRSDVTVIFDARRTVDLSVDVAPSAQAASDARDWFEAAWDTLGCEPLRPSGKVLLLDKIMGVADALGHDVLSQDQDRAQEFARHCLQALQSTRVTVDLPGLAVTF